MSKKIRYSPAFNRDWDFYYNQRHQFTFAGCNIEIQYNFESSEQGKTAKECFFYLDSQGKKFSCSEFKLLIEILTCKAALNLQIEIWSQSRAEGTLPLFELQEYMEYFQCPDWVLKAIENQRLKILNKRLNDRF
jgi:hypothetical protein